ncbi:MAG: excinuclease ABC subunit UvrC, partial [Candidatus Dojkabacteria bacterium]
PQKPGVYIWKDAAGEVLYVGKAVNIKNRVSSYFANFKNLPTRLKRMVVAAEKIETHTVDTEIEALLLETNLIKKYKPTYNVDLKDDKNYIWVKIHNYMDFPRVEVVREKKNDKAEYFGPYPDTGPVRRMLKWLRRIFKYRVDKKQVEEKVVDGKKVVVARDPKPDLEYHIGLSSGASAGLQTKEEYRKQITGLKRFLNSEHKILKEELKRKMNKLSKEKKFEQAAQLRDQLRDLEYITRTSIIDESVDEDVLKERKESFAVQGVRDLVEKLEIPGLNIASSEGVEEFRIECYDVSNIQGTNATSAMVVAIGGKAAPKQYRKFKIKTKNTPDDFAMMKETLSRRLMYLEKEGGKKEDESFSQMPDLIVIDGGKGQLSSVWKIMQGYKELGIDIPTIGLAKKHEEVWVPEQVMSSSGKDKLEFRLVRFRRKSPALRLLQLVRDEAHRFGLGYHRKLRSKGMTYSELDLIPGVGEVTKKRLFQAFGSVAGVKKASLEDIETVVKNKTTAFKIKKILSGN